MNRNIKLLMVLGFVFVISVSGCINGEDVPEEPGSPETLEMCMDEVEEAIDYLHEITETDPEEIDEKCPTEGFYMQCPHDDYAHPAIQCEIEYLEERDWERIKPEEKESIEVSVGEKAYFEISENPTTGSEIIPQIEDDETVELVENKYRSFYSPPELAGRGGIRFLEIEGLEEGNTELVLEDTRIGMDEVIDTEVIDIQVLG